MASIRIGFSTAFELENELVGIGTDNPTNTLQALGNIRSSNAKAVGVSTFTTFDGFTDTKLSLEGSAGAKQHTTSGEIIIEGEVTVSSGTTFTSGPKNLTVTNKFTLPKKTTYAPTVGSTRFNENLGALEFYTGTEWRAVNSRVDSGNRGRALKGCGRLYTPSSINIKDIEYFNIASKGNSTDFGNVVGTAGQSASYSSSTRGFFVGQAYSNDIEYVTIASEGNGIDFGNLTVSRAIAMGGSSSTRGILAGGWPSGGLNVIDYVEMDTLGDAIDFGDLVRCVNGPGATNNSTRMLILGGRTPSILYDEVMSITIASKGNAVDVGTWTQKVMEPSCGNISNGTRGISAGSGPNLGTISGLISSININSGGHADEFGDMTSSRRATAGASSMTRGMIMGGIAHPSSTNAVNTTEYITISTAGNAEDFGDLANATRDASGLSDCHGGLGGF